MPGYTCYDGEYVSICFFVVNAFYLVMIAILCWYTRKTNRWNTPQRQSHSYLAVASPPTYEETSRAYYSREVSSSLGTPQSTIINNYGWI